MRVLVWRPGRGTALFGLGVCLALSVLGVLPEPPGGSLRVAVPGSLQPAAVELVSGFTATHAEAQVHLLGVPDERSAAALLRAGRADVALLRGALGPGSGTPARTPGRSFQRLSFAQVGWEAVAVVTSPFAPPLELTMTQVAGLLSGERPRWQSLAPGASGRVEVLWPKDASVQDLLKGVAGGRKAGFGPEPLNAPALRRALLRQPGAVGFLAVQDLTPEVKVVPVAGATPTRADLAKGRYPLARPLFLAYPTAKARPGLVALLREARQRRRGPEEGVGVLLAGDFLADGPVAKGVKEHGPGWPLQPVAGLLTQAGLAVVNLEAPLSEHGWKIGDYLGAPAAVASLREAGIDAVTLANDHILDGDDPALLATLALLDREGIAHAGAGPTLERARQPAVLTAGGVKVALLAYGRPELGRTSTGRRLDASPWSPGIAPAEAQKVVEDVAKAKASVQVVVVAFHWGGEGEEQPRPEDRDLARAAIEAGAAVVFGQNPGEAQGLEVYQGGLILYNVGYLAREDPSGQSRLGVVAEVTLGPEGARQLKLIPVTCRGGQVKLLDGADRVRALQTLRERTMLLDRPPATPSSPPAPAPAPSPAPDPASTPAPDSAPAPGGTPQRPPGQDSQQPASNT